MHAGYWGLIGGTLGDAEEPASGALREVEEELGISRTEITLKFLCEPPRDSRRLHFLRGWSL
jgi:8-oxo-dGTP pyrophosphatase MutT (NUDIX family)